MPITRDLQKEQEALKSYTNIYKATPDYNNPTDKARLYSLAYKSGLPDELNDASYDKNEYSKLLGVKTAPTIGAGGYVSPTSAVPKTKAEAENLMTKANEGLDQFKGGNTFMNALQDVVRKKEDFNSMPLGESNIYKEAGLTGLGNLSASLNARENEIQETSNDFQNALTKIAGTYSDMGKIASDNWNKAKYHLDAFRAEEQKAKDNLNDLALNMAKEGVDIPEEFVKLLGTEGSFYQQMAEKIKAQKEAKKLEGEITESEILSYQKQLMDQDVTLSEAEARQQAIAKLRAEKGMAGTGGQAGGGVSGNTITLNNGMVYSDKGYAQDSTHTTQVANIYNTINTKYKKSNDIATIDNYIKSTGKQTPFESEQYGAGETIVSIADEYGVDPILLTSLMAQESLLGTSSVAKKNNNYGGISAPNGVVPEWLKDMGATLGSARPANEGGNYVKFATVEDGLRAQARLLSSRIQKGEQPTEEAPKVAEQPKQEENIYKGISKSKYDSVQKIIGDFENEQLVKDYNNIQNQYAGVRDMSNTPNASDTQALIYTFAKIMDPNSVVRESEYDTVEKYQTALLKRYATGIKRIFTTTGGLTPEAVDQMKKTMENKINGFEKSYERVRNQKIKSINQIAGKDIGDKVLTDYKGESANINQDQIITTPDGKKWKKVSGGYDEITS